MKKAVGILGTLAILWGCFSNVAFAADVNMISDKSVAGLEKVEITSETRVRLAGNEMLFLTKDSESVNLTDLDSRVLDDTQLIVNNVLKGAKRIILKRKFMPHTAMVTQEDRAIQHLNITQKRSKLIQSMKMRDSVSSLLKVPYKIRRRLELRISLLILLCGKAKKQLLNIYTTTLPNKVVV